MLIRPECLGDMAAISGVIQRAFAVASHANGAEQHIVNALRAAGALTVSLVAEQDHVVVGQVTFSPVAINGRTNQRWFGLGPFAVEPSLHAQGIGSALVRAGLEQLRKIAAAGCVVLGAPAYYSRFGFKAVPGLVYPAPPPEYFMAQALGGSMTSGEVTYHAAFAGEA